MKSNNLILNRFFSCRVFGDVINNRYNNIFCTVVQRYINDPDNKENGDLISEIYRFMSSSYRNEYFYKNTLLNRLLLGRHSLRTTTALTQIPIGTSKADFILINGKAVVYEIKTELDTFERLDSQINDYYKAFDRVCVVTSESYFERASTLLAETPVGIYVLTAKNTLSSKLKKEPIADSSKLSHISIFKVLRKCEYENILRSYFGKLPNASQVFQYSQCLEMFSKIPVHTAQTLAIKELKNRNRIIMKEIDSIPYELKTLFYFSKLSKSDQRALSCFLRKRYGG